MCLQLCMCGCVNANKVSSCYYIFFFHLLTQAKYLTSDLGFFPQAACLTFASNIEPSNVILTTHSVELYGSMTLRVASQHIISINLFLPMFFVFVHFMPV